MTEVYPFQPTQISGCTLWLDAADPNANGNIFNSGTSLSTWKDKTTGIVFTASVTNPTVSQTSYNNRNPIQFNGVSSYFSNGSFSFTLATRTIFIVCGEITPGANTGYLSFANTGTDYNRTDALAVESGSKGVNQYFQVLNLAATVNTGNGQKTPFSLFTDTFTSGSEFLYMNGTQVNSATTATSVTNSTGLILGARMVSSSISNFLNGTIAEVILYNFALSLTQRQQIEGYLAWKWGLSQRLPTTHPYYNGPPFSLAITLPLPPPLPLIDYESPSFIPTQIPGCALWFDGADINSILFNGSVITQWKDKSGNSRNAAATNNPTYVSSSLNNKSAIYFNNSQYFSGSYSAILTGTTFTAFSVAVTNTALPNSLGHDQRLLSLSVDNTTNDYDNVSSAIGFFNQATSSSLATYRNNAFIASNLITQNSPFFACATYSGTNGFEFMNGSPASSTGTSSSGSFNVGAFAIGDRSKPSGEYWSGYIGEVILYSSYLTTDQRQQVEGYLAWKWGLQANLPANHPYKSVSPINLTAPLSLPITIVKNLGNAYFNPLSIANCCMWMDAADPTTYTLYGSKVSEWRDKSTSGFRFTQANSVQQPSLIINALTKNNLLRFTSSLVTNLQDGTSLPVGTNPVSMSGVIKTTSSSANMCIWAKSTTNVTSGKWSWIRDGGTMLMTFEGPSAGGWNPGFTDTYPANTYRVMTMVCDRAAGNTKVYTNGTLNVTKTFTPDTTTNLSSGFQMLIGNYNAAGWSLDGDICELVFYTTALSTDQRQKIEGYLAWKWGLQSSLPATHPWVLFPPPPFS